MASEEQIRAAKARARSTLGRLRGFVGVGIGDGTLRVYVLDEAARTSVPAQFDGVPTEVVVSGEIRAVPRDGIPPPTPVDDGSR